MMALELGCHPESSSWLLLDLGDLVSIETVVETVQDSGSVSAPGTSLQRDAIS